jgi:hypothetical protein
VNREFADVAVVWIKQLLRDTDSPQAKHIAVVCTNFAAALEVKEASKSCADLSSTTSC